MKRGMSPNSLANLIHVKPGQRLPGAGHPKGVKNFQSRVNRFLDAKAPEELVAIIKRKLGVIPKDCEDIGAAKYAIAIMRGEPWALQSHFDRRDGKVKQDIGMEVTSIGDKLKQFTDAMTARDTDAESMDTATTKEPDADTA